MEGTPYIRRRAEDIIIGELQFVAGEGAALISSIRFDGDGMLHGVFFPEEGDPSPPLYTNRHLATPILSLSLLLMHSPLPSISLLISPLSSLHRIITAILHTFLLALEARVGTLSVANTNVMWWGSNLGSDVAETSQAGETKNDRKSEEGKDNRLLALCESGPPLEVRVPGLETVGWDRLKDKNTDWDLRDRRRGWGWKRWGLGRIQEVSTALLTDDRF